MEAETYKHILIHTWADLGVPLELSKLEGPSTCLTFLGIEIDTVTMQARLPREKLSSLKRELSSAIDRKSMLKRDLQRLTGLLQFATRVIKPGRPFLRRLYVLQDVGHHPTHNVRLNVAAQADIVWWHLFIEHWNGILSYGIPGNSPQTLQCLLMLLVPGDVESVGGPIGCSFSGPHAYKIFQ